MYYVYKHVRKDTGIVFYVGMGKGNRANSKSGRNADWRIIVNETDYDVIIVKDNLSIEEADKLERELIDKYGRIKTNNGPLVNITSGGQYNNNPSQYIRNKISNSLIGRKVSIETRNKMSKTRTGKKLPPMKESAKELLRKANLGKKQSDETKEKRKQTAIKNGTLGSAVRGDRKYEIIKRTQEKQGKICPHCGFQGKPYAAMNKHHFNNCKLKTVYA